MAKGGYNGGGNGNIVSGYCGTSGGGATDIRYFASTPTSDELLWNNATGLNNRIMVAGAGGGRYSGYGVNSGGLKGYDGNGGIGGTQTSGAAFGIGGTSTGASVVGGGGGGYYGGMSTGYDAAGGGSSYISGHAGCIAINNLSESTSPRTILSGCTSTSTSLDCSYHLSGKRFTNTIMIDGAGYQWTTAKGSVLQMPNCSGGTYASGKGNMGDGFAKISLIS